MFARFEAGGDNGNSMQKARSTNRRRTRVRQRGRMRLKSHIKKGEIRSQADFNLKYVYVQNSNEFDLFERVAFALRELRQGDNGNSMQKARSTNRRRTRVRQRGRARLKSHIKKGEIRSRADFNLKYVYVQNSNEFDLFERVAFALRELRKSPQKRSDP